MNSYIPNAPINQRLPGIFSFISNIYIDIQLKLIAFYIQLIEICEIYSPLNYEFYIPNNPIIKDNHNTWLQPRHPWKSTVGGTAASL